MSTGALICISLTSDELRDLDRARFEANFSFRSLKSVKRGVDGSSGDADALRAWRVAFGERKRSVGECVADLGTHDEGEGKSLALRYEPRCLREGNGLLGGTGVRYLSLGLRVNAEYSSMEMLSL